MQGMPRIVLQAGLDFLQRQAARDEEESEEDELEQRAGGEEQLEELAHALLHKRSYNRVAPEYKDRRSDGAYFRTSLQRH